MQQSNAGSDSPRSLDSFQRRTSSNRPSPQLTRDSNGSPDDNISVLNESMRNVMLDDLLDFKKQLIRLRNILQEVSSLQDVDACLCILSFVFEKRFLTFFFDFMFFFAWLLPRTQPEGESLTSVRFYFV